MGINALLRCLVALAGLPGATSKLTDSAGAAQTASSLVKHQLYMVCGDLPFYFKVGGSAANTDQYWPGNTPIGVFTGPNTSISILRATGATTNVSITAWNYDAQGAPASLPGDFGA